MKKSTIAHKYPTYRDDKVKGIARWLAGKRIDDNAEGLWRIHDKLYDFTSFVQRHPGGEEWLRVTEGIDITEQFETHHISNLAEKMLPKFYVREALLPRNYKITFDENGFYKTLKRKVANKLDFLDQSTVKNSQFYCDLTLTSSVLLSIIAARDNNFLIASFASLSLLWLSVITHNFIHQRDNWRMYLINFSMMSFREWRVFHAMSHHLYPNSYYDLEIAFFEPFLNWMPIHKTSFQKCFSWLFSPLSYTLIFFGEFGMRISDVIYYNQKLFWDDLIPFILPVLMLLFGNHSIWVVTKIWLFIISLTSFMYGIVGVNAGHHHNTIFHDGDELKSLDFGIYQLAATIDRSEVKKSHFLTLTTFGHHILHHFFPTVDHVLLPQLHEIFVSTCKEFESEFREFPWWELIAGQFRQLLRTKPIRI